MPERASRLNFTFVLDFFFLSFFFVKEIFQDWTVRFSSFRTMRRLKIRLPFTFRFQSSSNYSELIDLYSDYIYYIYRFYKAIKKKILGYSFVIVLCQPWSWSLGFLLEILHFTVHPTTSKSYMLLLEEIGFILLIIKIHLYVLIFFKVSFNIPSHYFSKIT